MSVDETLMCSFQILKVIMFSCYYFIICFFLLALSPCFSFGNTYCVGQTFATFPTERYGTYLTCGSLWYVPPLFFTRFTLVL
jgi:hypothetical protein